MALEVVLGSNPSGRRLFRAWDMEEVEQKLWEKAKPATCHIDLEDIRGTGLVLLPGHFEPTTAEGGARRDDCRLEVKPSARRRNTDSESWAFAFPYP